MSYHDRGPQNDLNPDARPYGRGPRRNGFAWMLGLIAVLIIAGLAISMIGGNDDNVAARNDTPAATTGSGSATPAPATRDRGTGTNPPAANTPTQAPDAGR